MASKRRRYLINGGFQVRWSSYITAVGTLTAIVLTILLWSELDQQNALLAGAINADEKLHEQTLDNVILLLNLPETGDEESARLNQRIAESKARLAHNKRAHRDQQSGIFRVRIALTSFVLLWPLVLFAWGILMTHRVAGPLYVIKTMLEQYQQNGVVDDRPLRKRDGFKDVHRAVIDALAGKSQKQDRNP